MKVSELAYISGIFDGEGTVILLQARVKWHRLSRQTRVVFYNTCLELLKWIQAKVGAGFIQLFAKAGTPVDGTKYRRANNFYGLTLSHTPGRNLLRDMLPYLIVKKKRAVKILGYKGANRK